MRKVIFALVVMTTIAFASCGTSTESTPTVTDTTIVTPVTVETVTPTVDTTAIADSTHK